MIHNDRSLGGGGVFLCFRETLPVVEQPSLLSDAEAVWAKLTFPRMSPFYICSFYRPPNIDTTPLTQLQTILHSFQLNHSPPNIIIAGDFNLPSIGASINPSPAYGRELDSLFLELVDDYGLEQLVYQPTRQGNILDLILTSHPDMITNVDFVPRISDHEVILFDINIQSSLPPDNMTHFVYLYHKGDLNSVKQDMCAFEDSFMNSIPECNSVDTNWNVFKEALTNSVSRHIPRKKIKAGKDLPWITRTLRKP